uniref:Uncharacterized protein n=1 Tax=Siphoviridae sp. ctxMM9 TaxID=2827973 RepID=A0A8S5T7C7_9CAUD|nr:MAG TPA: hypothetical protein [Siphoviridae sp. ctxMM9]
MITGICIRKTYRFLQIQMALLNKWLILMLNLGKLQVKEFRLL